MATPAGRDHQEREKRVVKRRGGRYAGLFILLIFIVGGLVVWTFYKSDSVGLRQTNVVIDGDPTVVASWQPKRDRLVLVTIPASYTIEAVRGLGKYPIRSLWQLGTMEEEGGFVLAQSLEAATGIPIPWYLGEVRGNIFSLGTLAAIVAGEIKTNMPISTFFSILWQFRLHPNTKTTEIPLGDANVTRETAPDGTILTLLAPEALDTILGDEFEEHGVRSEKFTVAVINTTQTPGLAERVARIIERIGGNVVRLGNEEQSVDRCQIRGASDHINSETAQVIAALFDCAKTSQTGEGSFDLTVLVGARYASRFAP